MPDVAHRAQKLDSLPLSWVGMKGIEIPILLQSKFMTPAKVTAQVSLDKKAARGIHMSRLYNLVQQELTQQVFDWSLLQKLSEEFLSSHQELSSAAKISVGFRLNLKRRSLKSDNSAFRSYPVRYSLVKKNGVLDRKLSVLVTYSSTCPASAALARQLIQENFAETRKAAGSKLQSLDDVYEWLGGTEGINATPHAQRSQAKISVHLDSNSDFSAEQLIDLVEEALQTAVQASVKREDEQEFALRNGQNLMFCEDAARKVKQVLDQTSAIVGYRGEFKHLESLHPHDAVAEILKPK